MSYPSVPRIGDRTSPSWIRSCPCVRDLRSRDVRAHPSADHRNRSAAPVAALSADLRAIPGRDRRRPPAPRRPRTRAARPGDATEHGARHRRTGLYDPGRRGLSADARRGRHVRLAVAAGLAHPGVASAHRRTAEPARRTGEPASGVGPGGPVGRARRPPAVAAPAADRRRDERRAEPAATRAPGARRVSAQGLAPARVAARAQRRTCAARLSESGRLPAAARTHRHLSDAVARRHLHAGTGVRHRRLPRHAGTHTAQPRAGGRARVVRGSRLSARTRVPVRDRRTTRPRAGGRRRDRRRTRHAAGRTGTLRGGDAVASESARAYAVAVPPHRVARLGGKSRGGSSRTTTTASFAISAARCPR